MIGATAKGSRALFVTGLAVAAVLSCAFEAPGALAQSPAPAEALGAGPQIEAGKDVGVFVWRDASGLHVRVSSNGTPVLFTGSIDFAEAVGAPVRVIEGAGGWVQILDGVRLVFSITASSELDGFDLAVAPTVRAMFDAQLDGVPAVPAQIFLGNTRANPKLLPHRL